MRDTLLAKASAATIALSLASTGAMAQSAVDILTDEILVTATKKANAEDVQDVPVAVTAYGADQLDALQVRDLQNLTYSIPNVSFDDIGTTPGTANFSIRGIGINSSIPSIDPTVGVFMDGVYMGINSGIVFDMFDLESIEVLRGPQGILFGRNVTGGAVLINTKRPSSEFEVDAKLAAESGLRGTGMNYYAMASVSGPLNDYIAFRVSAYYNDDKGWFERYDAPTASFEDFGAAETNMYRAAVSITPNDVFDLLIRYEHGQSRGDGPAAQNHPNGFGAPNAFFTAPRDSFDFAIDEPGLYDSKWDTLSATATLDVGFGDGTITNVFGYREFAQETAGDIDATPVFLFHSESTNDQNQLSNEIRYNGTFADGNLDVTAGVYYFHQEFSYNEIRKIAFGSVFFNGGGLQDQETAAVFAQADYRLTDALTLTAGGRYTYEEKAVVISNLLLNTTPCDVRISGSCTEDFVDNDKWENFTPTVGLQWTPSETMNVYAKWSQGVRSGGYNMRNTSFAFNPGPFDEETVNAYELGAKIQDEGGRFTINGAFFLNDFQDMQREINLADPIAGVVQIIRNTADSTIWGVDRGPESSMY